MILPIILIDGKIIDRKNRYRACLKANVKPIFMDYKGKLSAIDLVTSLNGIRRSDSPAAKAEIAKRIMAFLEDEEEDAKVEEALKQEDKLTAEKVRFVRDKKKIMAAAGMAGTTSEKMAQSFLIEEMSEKDSEMARLWDDAKKGKRSVSAVYNKAVRKKEAQENIEFETTPREEVAKDTRPILAQVNDKLRAEIKGAQAQAQEWKDRYFGLKAGYELLENKYDTLKNNLKMVLEGKADVKIVNNGIRKKAHPTPKELRKAELL